jgi:hypothetical protein
LCNTLFTLWYLWKARNDNRFQRKTWTSFQVRKAAQAHMHNYAQAFHDDDDAQQATTQILPGQMHSGGTSINPILQTSPTANLVQHTTQVADRYLVQLPSSLHGFRCYSDASLSPNIQQVQTRHAGIDVFIVNTDLSPPISLFVKATLQAASSVIQAEAAGLALAASIISTMHLTDAHLLVDNQLLVNYINRADHSNPPDWKIKPYTQEVTNLLAGTSTALHKITRQHNQMANLLARQSAFASHVNQFVFSGSCANPCHVHGCPFLDALQLVIINDVTILAATCC